MPLPDATQTSPLREQNPLDNLPSPASTRSNGLPVPIGGFPLDFHLVCLEMQASYFVESWKYKIFRYAGTEPTSCSIWESEGFSSKTTSPSFYHILQLH